MLGLGIDGHQKHSEICLGPEGGGARADKDSEHGTRHGAGRYGLREPGGNGGCGGGRRVDSAVSPPALGTPSS